MSVLQLLQGFFYTSEMRQTRVCRPWLFVVGILIFVPGDSLAPFHDLPEIVISQTGELSDGTPDIFTLKIKFSLFIHWPSPTLVYLDVCVFNQGKLTRKILQILELSSKL